MKINQAVILAGGKGTRLRPLTNLTPKPMALVNGFPFLDYLINSIKGVGINRVLLLVGYKYEKIIQYYGNMVGGQIIIEYSIGGVNDKTGRRILNAYDLLDDHFLLLYSDNYWPIELDQMINNYINTGSNISTTVFSNKSGTSEYGKENNIFVGSNNIVKEYDKSRSSPNINGVDIGYFIVSKELLDNNILSNISFEDHILTKLIKNRQLSAYITDQQYYYITTWKDLKNFEIVSKKNNYKPISNK